MCRHNTRGSGDCLTCVEVKMTQRQPKPQRRNRPKRSNTEQGWGPRTAGSINGEDVTFRQGTGSNEGHTIIADGQPSGRGFNARHNHYGQKREGGGFIDKDRGHYTGPGA